jgi:tRNA(Arg) A34 adenosine deaminase TadA
LFYNSQELGWKRLLVNEEFIRECHSLAINAGKKGNHTFGAILVHDGQIIMKAENTVETEKDSMRHAEYNLVLQSKKVFSKDILEQCVLYTSTAPCLLCTATILMAYIPKIVYSVSHETFDKLIPGVHRYISCDEIVKRLGSNTEVVGPILEDEGLLVFQYWGGKFTPLEQILQSTGKNL